MMNEVRKKGGEMEEGCVRKDLNDGVEGLESKCKK
jgi:hypothetical protein